MPNNPPPVYKWNVTHSGGTVSFDVEAAYPVIEDSGHMVLKDADHKPVFSAEPGLGCTFKRNGLATDPAADNPPPGTGYCPHGFPPTARCHQCSPVTAPAGDGTRL